MAKTTRWLARWLTTGAALLPAALAAQAPQALDGTWTSRWKDGAERPWVQMRVDDGRRWSMTLPEAEVDRLVASEGPAGEVGLVLDRLAGRLEMEGMLSGERGRGIFTFRPDPAFAGAMDGAGIRVDDADDHLVAAMHDIRPSSATRLRDAGFAAIDFGDVVGAHIFQVDTTWIRELRELGVDGDLDDFIAFRIHGVTPEFVRDVRSWDIGEVDEDDLVAFRIHGVNREFVGQIAEWNLGEIGTDDLIAFRIHGVSRDFANEVRGWGLGEADGDDLVALRIHGVSGEFVASMRDAGVPPADLDQAIAFRIHGVDPELVTDLEEMGFEELDGDDLIKVKIHGFDRMLRRRGGGG